MNHPFTSPVTTLDSPQQAGELVRQCAREYRPLVDYGLAHQGLGNPPPAPHQLIRQTGSVLEHYPRDFAVRVAAGTTVGTLQATLRPTGQFLPLDADDDLTLGECINHNVHGPLRLAYGSLRDLILGLHYLDAQGQDIHVGGRTVKNVAGLDVSRLMVGSLGELGLIHQATVRTYALPEQVLSLQVQVQVHDLPRLDQELTPWLLSDAASAHLSLHRRHTQWHSLLGYFGKPSACAAQLMEMERRIQSIDLSLLLNTSPLTFDQDADLRRQHRAWRRTAEALVKIVVPPAQTGQWCLQLEQWACEHAPDLFIDTEPAFGRLWVGGQLSSDQTIALDQSLLTQLPNLGGWRAWYQRPAQTIPSIPAFAPTQPDWPMLRKIKHAMDPVGIFNPGRFLPLRPEVSWV